MMFCFVVGLVLSVAVSRSPATTQTEEGLSGGRGDPLVVAPCGRLHGRPAAFVVLSAYRELGVSRLRVGIATLDGVAWRLGATADLTDGDPSRLRVMVGNWMRRPEDQVLISLREGRADTWVWYRDGAHLRQAYRRGEGRVAVWGGSDRLGRAVLVEMWGRLAFDDEFPGRFRAGRKETAVLRTLRWRRGRFGVTSCAAVR